ncbi:hypothetical protein ARSEF4850_000134 [Beauveria asiatica]
MTRGERERDPDENREMDTENTTWQQRNSGLDCESPANIRRRDYLTR